MSADRTIAAAGLYWALVDAAPIGRRLRSDEIASLAEDVLPVPLEGLHLIQRRLRDGRMLVCGIERDELASMIEPGLLSLTPSELPDFLDADQMPPLSELNLLVGAFEPPEIRSARRRFVGSALAATVLVTTALVIGFISRGLAAQRALAEVDAHRDDIVRAVIATDPKAPSALPADLRLMAELRELRSTRSNEIPSIEDVSGLASAVLSLWPPEVTARLDSVRLTPARSTEGGDGPGAPSVAVSGWSRDAGEAQRVVDALSLLTRAEVAGADSPAHRRAVSGLAVRLEPPQLRATNDGVQFTIVLTLTRSSVGVAP
jgi:hypothetical protein